MMKSTLLYLAVLGGLLLFGLSGCAVTKQTAEVTDQPKQTESNSAEIADQPKQIESTSEEVTDQPKQTESTSDEVLKKMADEYEIIGEYEPITIVAAATTFPARIDTGAKTSSIDAQDIVQFERDGKPWARFALKNRQTGELKKLESKIVRVAEIKRHGAKPQERPVVKLGAKLGNKKMNVEFSLTDRTSFKFPVLVGRNILTKKYLVDVSKSNTTSLMKEE